MGAELWHTLATHRVTPPTPQSAQQIRGLSPTELDEYKSAVRSWLYAVIVEAPHLGDIPVKLTKIVDANLASPPGAKNIACVDGPNTVGKSTLMRAWAQQQYRNWIAHCALGVDQLPQRADSAGSARYVPVVWVDLPADADIAALDTAVLNFIGINSSGAARDLTARVVRAIETHDIRLLVIDDAHLLRTRLIRGRAVLDHLKHLNTELGTRGASMVLVGANLADGLITDDPQIKGRLRSLSAQPLTITDGHGQRLWQEQLLCFEEVLLPYLPKSQPGVFAQTHAGLIWRRTQAHLGDVAELLRQTTLSAIENGSFQIRQGNLVDVALSERAHNEEAKLNSIKKTRSVA